MEWIVLISVFAVDLAVKAIVENFLDYDTSVTLIPYFLNARKVHNYSAAFGSSTLNSWLGATGARIFFCVFAVAASVAFILVLIRQKGKSRVFRISLALFVAGAMGNCIDRMFLGYVRDFIEFVYLGLTINNRTTWPYVFNIADVALVTGVILIIFYFLFLYKDTDKKKQLGDTAENVELKPADAPQSVAENDLNGEHDTVDGSAETGNARDEGCVSDQTAVSEKTGETIELSENTDTADQASVANGFSEDTVTLAEEKGHGGGEES